MYETHRVGLDYYWLYFGIIFAIAIFSLPLMTTLLDAHQQQAMALKNAPNNNTTVSSARTHNLTASLSTTNVSNASKAPPTKTPIPTRPTNNTGTTAKDQPPTVSNMTLPIISTKPMKVEFIAKDPDKNDTFTFHIVHLPAHGKLVVDTTGHNVTYTPNATFFDSFTYQG